MGACNSTSSEHAAVVTICGQGVGATTYRNPVFGFSSARVKVLQFVVPPSSAVYEIPEDFGLQFQAIVRLSSMCSSGVEIARLTDPIFTISKEIRGSAKGDFGTVAIRIRITRHGLTSFWIVRAVGSKTVVIIRSSRRS